MRSAAKARSREGMEDKVAAKARREEQRLERRENVPLPLRHEDAKRRAKVQNE